MLNYGRIAHLANQQESCVLCIVTQTTGSTPRKSGARMVVIADGSETGKIEGTIGGGAVENEVRIAALKVLHEGKPRCVTFSLTQELAMCCGGSMTVYLEPLSTRRNCIIFGAGHIAESLVPILAQVDFNVFIADPRAELLTPERFALAYQLIDGYSHSDLQKLPFGAQTCVVIATHSHQSDQELVEAILPLHSGYFALVGSQRKAAMTQKRCSAKKFVPELISNIRCPAGLEIGAETPNEIAISIAAEIIQWRRCQTHKT